MRKTRQQRDQELRDRIAQAAGYKNHNDAVAKLKPAKVGEFYADYDGDTGLFCVFHTENEKAVASYSSAVEAEKAANDRNSPQGKGA